MGQPVKIAIAGAGYGAKVALPGYTKLDEFETVAVWSRRAERARQVATDYGLAVGYELRMKETRQRLIEHAREVVGRPRMASISLVQSDHADPFSRPYTWVHDARMGGGRLQGYGVHDLDLLLAVFPDVEAVAAA